MNLHSPVTDLKGIGEKTAVPFAKAGIHTVQDLIEYYPRAYDFLRNRQNRKKWKMVKNMQYMRGCSRFPR